jgi:hypothetical protein
MGKAPAFRRLTVGARSYADQLERVTRLSGAVPEAQRTRLRALARALVDEITAEQERRRRSRS